MTMPVGLACLMGLLIVGLAPAAHAADADYSPSLLAGRGAEDLRQDLEAQLKSASRFVRLNYKGYSMITYDLVTGIRSEGESLSMEFDKTQVVGQGPTTGIFTYQFRFADLADLRFDAQTCSDTKAPLPDRMIVRTKAPDGYRLCDTLFTLGHLYDSVRQEAEARFARQAADYRALAKKPAVSEDLRRLIVQAEVLRERKDYDGAAERYRRAVELDPVAYPAAYFNLALLYEMQGLYPRAIAAMKRYLALQPTAPDARAAQDKIYGWEMLAGEK